MSRYDANAHIPKSNMSAYIGSPPKAPLDPGTAEFVKGKPAIVEPAVRVAKNVHYYQQRIAALASALEHNAKEYRKEVSEFKSSGVWKSEFKTWGRTCRECIGISPQRAHVLISELTESYEQDKDETSTPLDNSAKARELETLNALPDLMADFDADLAATVHAGPAPRQAPDPVPERQPRDRTDNGKPIYAMPVWKELEEGCGKLINRVAAANDLSPNKEKYQRVRTGLLTIFDEIQSWHEMTRKL